MKVSVALFAQARDLIGDGKVEIDLPAGADVQMLRQRLQQQCPAAAELIARASIAIDDRFASAGDVLDESQEVSLIPPVSGG